MRLTINSNDVSDAQTIQVRYRLYGTSNTFVVVAMSPLALPYVVDGLQNGQYEVGVRKLCPNGQYSSWDVNQTAFCAPLNSFSAVLTGSNFVVTAGLVAPQTKIQVQVTDPNGGVAIYTHDFGSQSGSFNIAVTAGLGGGYVLAGSGICDDTVSPVYASIYSNGVTVNVPVVGNSFTTKTGNNSGTICGTTNVTVYSSSSTLLPGSVVYFDSALTLPVNNQAFISIPGGVIYALASNGVIGASTGLTC